ncbi:hypothetical protein AB0K68_46570, partial [Streptomyces sp. NPDC050698]
MAQDPALPHLRQLLLPHRDHLRADHRRPHLVAVVLRESLFPSLGIYSPKGQTYEPVDRDQLMYYKEA